MQILPGALEREKEGEMTIHPHLRPPPPLPRFWAVRPRVAREGGRAALERSVTQTEKTAAVRRNCCQSSLLGAHFGIRTLFAVVLLLL
jgi:hypothetical protein